MNKFIKIPRKAVVVVLGELARSPRMQYHCLSLVNDNYHVSVISTGGKDLACNELETHPMIDKEYIPNTKYVPPILSYIIKPIWQAFYLLYLLLCICIEQCTPHVIITQNPPSVPTLPILWTFCRLVRCKYVIDWHNYGFTILSLKFKPTHLLVRLYQAIELSQGRLADAGFCVSKAMRSDLINKYNVSYPLCVLYDKPPKHFKPFTRKQKMNFYRRIQVEIPQFKSILSETSDKTAVIMSSTSWTEDEDFGILLDTFKRYDLIKVERKLPKLICVITGKGPLKTYYEKEIEDCSFEHIQVALPWLESSDYPKMVASCDIGISLHKSSSGVDLPMKVVDMFGCGVPVLAYNNNNAYVTIRELVREDVYGKTFRDSNNLFELLTSVLTDTSSLDKYKENINLQYRTQRWEANWTKNAKPVLDLLIRFRPRA